MHIALGKGDGERLKEDGRGDDRQRAATASRSLAQRSCRRPSRLGTASVSRQGARVCLPTRVALGGAQSHWNSVRETVRTAGFRAVEVLVVVLVQKNVLPLHEPEE